MYDEYLAHYGTKGMKWGKRKRQVEIMYERDRRKKLVSKEYLDSLRSNTTPEEYNKKLNELYSYRQRKTSGAVRAEKNVSKLSSKAVYRMKAQKVKDFIEKKKKRPTGRTRVYRGPGKSVNTHGKKLKTGKVGRQK